MYGCMTIRFDKGVLIDRKSPPLRPFLLLLEGTEMDFNFVRQGPRIWEVQEVFFFHIESKVNLRRKLRNDWLEKWTIWVEVCPILKMGKNISARGCNCLINNKIYMQDLHTIPRFPADSFKMTALQVGWKKSAFLKPFAPPWESRNIIDSKDIKSAGVAVRQKTLRKRKEFPFHPSKTGWLWEEVFSESIAPTKF